MEPPDPDPPAPGDGMPGHWDVEEVVVVGTTTAGTSAVVRFEQVPAAQEQAVWLTLTSAPAEKFARGPRRFGWVGIGGRKGGGKGLGMGIAFATSNSSPLLA